MLQTAFARLAIRNGDNGKGEYELERIVALKGAPLEAFTSLGELLLGQGRVAEARQWLKRALTERPDNPLVQSLIARTYIKSGPFYNADFGVQLATLACKNSGWVSPREMHVLAEAYLHTGDKMSALLIASRAKEVGSRVLGSYRDVKILDRMIQDLSAGSQA